jgi:hypothetical protein
LFLSVPKQLQTAFAQDRSVGDVNAGFMGGAADGFGHTIARGVAEAVELVDVWLRYCFRKLAPVLRARAGDGDLAADGDCRAEAGGDFVFGVIGMQANAEAFDGPIAAQIVLAEEPDVVVFGMEFIVGLLSVAA